MRNFFPQWYSSANKLSASSQTAITVPPTQIRIGDTSLESFNSIVLNVNSDSSWDFGQNISTWQPNTTYTTGQVIRPDYSSITSPLSISDCGLWLDAAQGVTYNGSNQVTAWADQSGNGRNFTGGGSSVLRVASAQGGLPTIRFSGSYFSTAGKDLLRNISGCTAFYVGKPLDSSTQSSFFHVSAASGATGRRFCIYYNYWNKLDCAVMLMTQNEVGYDQTIVDRNHLINNDYDITSLSIKLSDTKNLSFFRNGSLLSSLGTIASGFTSFPDTDSASIYLGRDPNGTRPFLGDLSEFIVFRKTLSDSERMGVENYLANKYSLQTSKRVYEVISSGTSGGSAPSFSSTEGTSVTDNTVSLNTLIDYSDIPPRAGKDVYIYSVIPTLGHTPKLLLSANATYPHGYDATNSRKIGGFHCLCANVGTVANHPLSGYLAGDILPLSVWCLKHRAANGNNAGLVYDENDQLWKFIYLSSASGSAAASVYGATILDGITWFVAVDYGAASGVRLLKDHEFTNLADGCPESVNIYGSSDPVTTGAHIDTNSVRIISNIGCEDCSGVQRVWLDEQSYFYDTNATVGWKNQTGGRGQLYTQGNYGTCKLITAHYHTHGVYCGSLAREANLHPWYSGVSLSVRYCVSTLEK